MSDCVPMIWWLDQLDTEAAVKRQRRLSATWADCDEGRIHLIDPPDWRLPGWLAAQLRSRQGRSGGARLWVDERFGSVQVSVLGSVWPDIERPHPGRAFWLALNRPEPAVALVAARILLQGCGGIVVDTESAAQLVRWPGFVTDRRLDQRASR